MNKKQFYGVSEIDAKTRRKFLKSLASGAATVLMVQTPGAFALQARGKGWKQMSMEHIYAYVIDINKCIGWGGCVRACEIENDVPPGQFRTWIERYIVTDAGGVFVESPDGGKNGFVEAPKNVRDSAMRSYFVPKMCNHCENPPCTKVCPVGATFKSPEGFVLVDEDYCIACGSCVQACPYGSRFINHKTHTADKCTWCYHRVQKGLKPACVEACPTGARLFGDLKDPDDEVSKIFDKRQWLVLKPEMFTSPMCLYVELPKEVV